MLDGDGVGAPAAHLELLDDVRDALGYEERVVSVQNRQRGAGAVLNRSLNLAPVLRGAPKLLRVIRD